MAPIFPRPLGSGLHSSTCLYTRRCLEGPSGHIHQLSVSRRWLKTLSRTGQSAWVPAVPKKLIPIRYGRGVTSPLSWTLPISSSSTIVLPERPYSELSVGVPKEIVPGERRVALTPANAALLMKKGFGRVVVQRGAGAAADFPDEAYEKAGATLICGPAPVWAGADIVLKVQGPYADEVDCICENQTVISLLQPTQNKKLVQQIAARKATYFAMDMIPRISRAQVFDALSSMANIAGYKAVLEASNIFGSFMTEQVTAAGKTPPCKVLVIGAGVAGLSAIATARRMGAIVCGFDTRPAARDQVQSLGAEFLEIDVREDGSCAGGYAKEMSKEFIEAEMRLFKDQAKEVDIIITTALIPGKPAPKLITLDMLEAMKPGGVVVDLAAEAGGNCEATKKGAMVVYDDIKVIGQCPCISPRETERLMRSFRVH